MPSHTNVRKRRGKRMCPNQDCAKYQEPTGIMGGCECGTALVDYYIAPNDDQLWSFTRVMLRAEADRRGFPVSDMALSMATEMALRGPGKAEWLANHRKMQDLANGLGE